MGIFDIFERKVPLRKYTELMNKFKALQEQNQLLLEAMKDVREDEENKDGEIRRLNREKKELNAEIERRNEISGRFKAERLLKDKEESEKKCFREVYLTKYAGDFYRVKKSFLSDNEQKVYYCLNRIFPKKEKEKSYVVFANTRVADFVSKVFNQKYEKYEDAVWQQITNKHVDFLVCLYFPNGTQSVYIPKLAIEVYGDEHFFDKIKNKRIQENDAQKAAIFKAIGLPFIIIPNEDVKKGLGNYLLPKLEQEIFQLIDRL